LWVIWIQIQGFVLAFFSVAKMLYINAVVVTAVEYPAIVGHVLHDEGHCGKYQCGITDDVSMHCQLGGGYGLWVLSSFTVHGGA